MKVYKPSLRTIDKEEFSLIKEGKEFRTFDTADYFFSSERKAKNYLKKKLEEVEPDEEEVVFVSIQELELDNPSQEYKLKIYDTELNFKGQYDLDTDGVKNPKYSKGDWILFLCGDEVRVGLIWAEAAESEPYYVIYEDKNLRDCSPHSHLNELFIIRKITEDEAKKLLPSKFYQNILRRFKE